MLLLELDWGFHADSVGLLWHALLLDTILTFATLSKKFEES